jgi:hypothetical protein
MLPLVTPLTPTTPTPYALSPDTLTAKTAQYETRLQHAPQWIKEATMTSGTH